MEMELLKKRLSRGFWQQLDGRTPEANRPVFIIANYSLYREVVIFER